MSNSYGSGILPEAYDWRKRCAEEVMRHKAAEEMLLLRQELERFESSNKHAAEKGALAQEASAGTPTMSENAQTECPDPIPFGDPVNHPPHYLSHPSGVECITITEHMSFLRGNAMKYLWRADHKGGLADLKKAQWYITREIQNLEGGK